MNIKTKQFFKAKQSIKVGTGIFATIVFLAFSGISYGNAETADYSSINELNKYVLSVQEMPSNEERRAFLLLAKDSLADDTLTQKEFEKLDSSYQELREKFGIEITKHNTTFNYI